LGNAVFAGLISNIVGWSFLTILVIAIRSENHALRRVFHAQRHRRIRVWELLGGFGGACFLAVQSSAVPAIGIALFTIGLIGGQTLSSLLVDRIGLSPNGKSPISKLRLVTAVITLFGVSIAVWPKLSHTQFKFMPMVLSLGAGIVVAFQQALNGRINVIAKRPLATAWFNFSMGTLLLLLFLTLNLLFGGKLHSLPSNPLLYAGGLIGVAFIAISAYTIKELGVLNFIMFSVAGQLATALLIDWIAPTKGANLSSYTIFGTLITLFAISLQPISKLIASKRATTHSA
jgi:transporter family-2 protein